MRKLIATTALALIIGGPAMAQATQDQTQQQQDQQQAQQQPAQQDQQMAGQDQQMMAEGGFYQPDANDIFLSNLMDAQVYAPAEGGQQQQMQQEGQAQPADQQQQQAATAETEGEGAEVEVTVEDAEGDTATETIETTGDDQQDQEVQQAETEQQDQQLEQQQAETDEAQQQQMQQAEGQQQMGDQPYGGGLQARTVQQDELDQYENIGSVSDLVVDEQGQLRAIVLDVGGFLGMGAREVALSVDEIELARDQDDHEQMYIITQVGANELENAPEFDRAQLEEQRQQQMAGTTDQDAQIQQDQQAAADEGPDATQEQQAAQQQDGQQWRGDRQAMAAPQMEREGFQQAEAAEITADNLLGANVYDINDDNIGSVSDIVMGADGAAEYAVIDVGGFLGFGTHTVAIGFDEMQVLHDDGWADLRVYVDVTQEELENMPEYEQN